MAQPKQYEVYDKITGEFLVEGTARYCSEVLRVSAYAIRDIAKCKYNSHRFLVEEQAQDGPAKEANSDLKKAAMEWDKLTGPLRKKYGIPAYKEPVKEGKNDGT